jgi:membrane fusion protein (multidrug efflux system)
MFVTANLQGAMRPDAILVPQLAVQQGPKGHLVYVVNQTGVAEVRPVIVGDYYGDKDIVIAAGLQAGDRVIVDGMLKVVPGQPVQIAQGPATGSPSPAAAQAEAKSGEAPK